MAGLATQETDRSVTAFVEGIGNKAKEVDSFKIIELMKEASGCEPKVWSNEKILTLSLGLEIIPTNEKEAQNHIIGLNWGLLQEKQN